MPHNRKQINRLRAQIDGVVPRVHRDPLPPQPSIIHGVNPDPFLVRAARKIDRASHRLGKIRHYTKMVVFAGIGQGTSNNPKNLIKTLHFKKEAAPVVSIVIPIYNKFELTAQCLQALMRHGPRNTAFEVIVVDNASSDASHLFSDVPGLHYIRNKKNEGFVDGCNIGASQARGRYVAFLNNDAMITPGWLENLLATISSNKRIGLVGSKIIYPDGRLQEAGGIIYKDGTGCNYGKNDHPDRYQYNYIREVDYCSGASIVIPKELFDSFGGFDTLYAPAYYEDTDLAFKVRRAGLKVIYQPASVVYHIEGATAGTSMASGFKRFQAINHEKFLKRWGKTLENSHYNEAELYLARDRSGEKLALIVDELIPTPDKDSGSVRIMRIIKELQALGYKVTFFPNYISSASPYIAPMQQAGIEVVYGPITFNDFISQYGEFYDTVILSRPRIASYFLDICQAFCSKATIIFDTVDLHYLRLGRQAEFEADPEKKSYLKKMADIHEALEKDIMNEVDATLVVSDVEKKMLDKEGFQNITVVSNIHKLDKEAYTKGFGDRKDILFVGGYSHQPNIDAITWFAADIFPMIRRVQPDIKLHVVGSHMPDDLKELLQSQSGIIVDGFVTDEALHNLLKSARVFVAPLRYGAGVKGKVGQAIEFGLPVVSTTIGAEGMHLKDGESANIADTPDDFANKVIDLYNSPEKWSSIQKNARSIIEENFSPKSAHDALRKLLK